MIVGAVVIIGASFFGGVKYGQGNASGAQGSGTANARGGFARGGGARGAGFTTGDVISKDDKSITVKMRDGSSKIIFFSGSTEVGKFVTGATSDIEVGKSVMINGQTNSDGSINAQSIQIRPPMTQTNKPAQN